MRANYVQLLLMQDKRANLAEAYRQALAGVSQTWRTRARTTSTRASRYSARHSASPAGKTSRLAVEQRLDELRAAGARRLRSRRPRHGERQPEPTRRRVLSPDLYITRVLDIDLDALAEPGRRHAAHRPRQHAAAEGHQRGARGAHGLGCRRQGARDAGVPRVEQLARAGARLWRASSTAIWWRRR